MQKSNLSIPRSYLVDLLKSQPEEVIIDLFEELMITSDVSPLSDRETSLISEAMEEYNSGRTIKFEI